ncbi:MAG: glutamate synthase large subunit [Clostridiales bacterium]|jgi:glutamate synthase (ferredoxin)|nr:glutamate synthase large subunit [Clostridiales bacterium]
MSFNDYPQKQGLYDPAFEKDSCGIGFVARINGEKSHAIIEDALTLLRNMTHRGGVGSESDSGDGAGILLQIPHKFFERVCLVDKIKLPAPGDYAVGMLFLSPDESAREDDCRRLKEILEREGLGFLGLRRVPVHKESAGKTPRETMPHIAQVFISKPPEIKDETEFERALYIVQKRAERLIRSVDKYFYFASLSCRTLVYKGMLTPKQLDEFYVDLKDLSMETAIAMVHSRFSTNTFPSWERAHPNRYIIHNGEINTIRSNINWLAAKETDMESPLFGEKIRDAAPVLAPFGTDSAMLDNFVQLLCLSGFSLPEALCAAIPEPWENDVNMDAARRAFYEYNSCVNEGWDGPAAVCFTDGAVVGATLDRNGLRPARYCVTEDGRVILSSETGSLFLPQENVKTTHVLSGGKMLVIDTAAGEVVEDGEIKRRIAAAKPYREWTAKISRLADFAEHKEAAPEALPFSERQRLFGYTWEDLNFVIKKIIEQGEDPITAMGADAPLAVCSERPQLLYNYFKQMFAQVTNPPIDAIREKVVTSSIMYLGSSFNILERAERHCRKIRLDSPVLSNGDMARIKALNTEDFKTVVLPILFERRKNGLEDALSALFAEALQAVEGGANIIVLTDRGASRSLAPIPALLAVSGLHHFLIRRGARMRAKILLESGEPREVHHFALLIGYGASAVNPYMAYENISYMAGEKLIEKSPEEAVEVYMDSMTKGIVKIMSKMGISTAQSYHGAQIFEILGLNEEVTEKYFTNTVTRIGGLGIREIQEEAEKRCEEAFSGAEGEALPSSGNFKWRRGGEYHIFNPESITLLQQACREGDYEKYKKFAALVNSQGGEGRAANIRGMLDVREIEKPLPLSEIEPVSEIVRRFKTGAMSYGSISQEAHECMALAMNRLGGKSNSGEGGEIVERLHPKEGEPSRCSAIKQVASGRFGVTLEYLQSAREIQIKMAQGAKPGEGGHLPGGKVYPWIAKARFSTPGVGLISPPPHHDIYSIEDLAQLIHDLKNGNPGARISVKLVSEAGVGTIAVGVAKGLADVILISGYDGGTGAAPHTSIRHTGLPWELGVAETHQTLLLNNLRSRVVIETDGKLLTGRDVLVAALLGAEEYGFSTGPLIAMGCVMMRVCNLNTCPVGVATQDPRLRAHFTAKPEHVENFMRFIAMDLREHMARIGARTVNELIGHTEKLSPKRFGDGAKARTVNLHGLLYQPKISAHEEERYCSEKQNHRLEETMDVNTLVPLCRNTLAEKAPVYARLRINNTNRAVGAILSGEVYKRFGAAGLPEDTIKIQFEGYAGQSFGAFLINGATLRLDGQANDYVGKSLSGGKIIISPENLRSVQNIVAGNVCLYGATSGKAFINGLAGERFAIRNSGAKAVVEGIGAHGCEYMTGGVVVVLGSVGKNFGAGMSGGVAYVPRSQELSSAEIKNGALLTEEITSRADIDELCSLTREHYKETGSVLAGKILENPEFWKDFIKVIPKRYKEIIELYEKYKALGQSEDEAKLAAFNDLK